jgi:hypothetical protein
MKTGDFPLLLRVLAWSLALPVLKRLLPLPVLVRLMSDGDRRGVRDEAHAQRLATLVRRVLRLRGGDPNCLEQSLLLYRYLPRVGLRPDLIVGFRSGVEHAPIGHAWLVVDDAPFEESNESLDGYSPLLLFRPDGFAGHGRVRP